MDRPALRGFMMMHMMGVGEASVHIVWQYTNGMRIWQVFVLPKNTPAPLVLAPRTLCNKRTKSPLGGCGARVGTM